LKKVKKASKIAIEARMQNIITRSALVVKSEKLKEKKIKEDG